MEPNYRRQQVTTVTIADVLLNLLLNEQDRIPVINGKGTDRRNLQLTFFVEREKKKMSVDCTDPFSKFKLSFPILTEEQKNQTLFT